jgi:hypothetical protein
MALTVAVLESLFTADIKDFTKKAEVVDKAGKALVKAPTTVKVDANTGGALADMVKVETSAKKIDGKLTTAKVDADASKARTEIDGLGDEGEQAGDTAGKGLSAGILGALIALPVAGAVVGIGVAIGKSLMDGLQVEVRSDRLMAQTGLDAASTAIIARAAGEAYASNWGESLAANMDTARIAIQGGLLDPSGTAKDSQAIIASLSGVADILGEEIPAVSRSTSQLLRTGLAKDAAGAFDLLVKGTQSGLNVSEDLLDTVNEYGTQFSKLGLSGPAAFGLLSQAVKGGARDTDTAADALKEFAIRAVDGSKTSVAGFEAMGLSAEDMAAKILKGGPEASEALGLTLQSLRDMKDPTEQAATAVALFGTKAEDMGTALYDMDLSTAVAELGSVEGAAKTAMDTLGDNAAGSIATAQRNIEVAADGIKGALATAFNPQIQGFSTFVSENREAVMQFLLDMANGGIDAGRALANAAAAGLEGFGSFVGTAGPAMTDFILSILEGMNSIPFVDLDDAVASFKDMKDGADKSFASFDAGSQTAADSIRTNLIEKGLDPAQEKLNNVAIPMVAQAAMHDASVSLAKDIDGLGYSGETAMGKLDLLNGTVDTSTGSGKLLDEQIRGAVAALDAESAAAAGANETQDQLNQRYEAGRVALVNQLTQMGYTAEEAQALADKYGAIPANVATSISLDTAVAEARLATFKANLNVNNVIVTAEMRTGYYKDRADGGHVQAANGMDRQSMIAPGGANILWAEPETGWETYISGKPSQRTRNVGLLKETASRFGMMLLDPNVKAFANGGTATASGPAAYGGPQVQIIVERLIQGTPQDVGHAVAYALLGGGES